MKSYVNDPVGWNGSTFDPFPDTGGPLTNPDGPGVGLAVGHSTGTGGPGSTSPGTGCPGEAIGPPGYSQQYPDGRGAVVGATVGLGDGGHDGSGSVPHGGGELENGNPLGLGELGTGGPLGE